MYCHIHNIKFSPPYPDGGGVCPLCEAEWEVMDDKDCICPDCIISTPTKD